MARPRTRLRFLVPLPAILMLALFVVEPAAANTLAPTSGHSPGAGDISDAYTVIAIIATVLAVVINVALIRVAIRYRGERGAEPARLRGTRRIQLRVGTALAVLAAAVFVVGVVYNQRERDIPATSADGLADSKGQPQSLTVAVTGQQWIWRYTYPDGTFAYYQLVVPVHTDVNLKVDSTDVVHRWWIPELGGKADAVPGRINRVSFRADQEGIYKGESAAFSGASYPAMRAQVKVVSVPVYKSWLAAQKKDLASAQAIVQKRVSSESPNIKQQVSG